MKKILLAFLISIQTNFAQNYALSLDGTNDYVEIPDNNNLDLTTNYTLEAWIKPNTIGNYKGIISKYHSGLSNGYTLRVRTGGVIDFNDKYTASGVITNANWYHIAAVNSSGTLSVFVNGVNQSLSGTAISVQANSDPVKIGVDFSPDLRCFDGAIDEVRIWNVARTQSQIKSSIYSVDPASAGLVIYYKFNDGSGTTLTNSVSGGASGTLSNGPTWSNNSPVQGVTNALNFDGTDDHVIIDNESNFDFTTNMTVEAWIKVASFTKAYQTIISKGDQSWRVARQENTNNIGFHFTHPDGSSNSICNGTTNVATNTWIHFAATYNGSNMKLYINGALETTTATTNTINNSAHKVAIGENLQSTNRYFHGSIDEVRIWNVARSAEQISANYNKELPITENGLVAYYSFNQGIADGTNTGFTTLIDNASTNNGTLTNFGLTSTSSNYVSQSASITTTDASTLLPVELKSFTARLQNNNAILNWKTATETNNSGFEVERISTSKISSLSLSKGNQNWDKIGFVRGSGTSSVEKNYTFTDNNLRNGKYSYRLKQIDLDGTTEYSQTREVEVGGIKSRLRTNPNPFNNTTIINFEIDEKTEVKIKLYDMLGRVVAEILNNEPKGIGEHEIKFNASNLASGVYLLKFQTNTINEVEKLVLMK